MTSLEEERVIFEEERAILALEEERTSLEEDMTSLELERIILITKSLCRSFRQCLGREAGHFRVEE